MAAPTKYYVDQTSGSNGGAGTSGDPWLTIEYALETGITTADVTNGDEIWVKGGGETTTKSWEIQTWLSTSYRDSRPLVIRGCTAFDTQDAGRCSITVPSTYYLVNSTSAYGIQWAQVDFDFASSAANMISCGIDACFIDCSFSRSADVTGRYFNGSTAFFINNLFEDGGTSNAVQFQSGCFMFNVAIDQVNYARTPTNFLILGGATTIFRNVVKMSSTGHTCAILYADRSIVMNNSIYANGAATGKGLRGLSGAHQILINNLVEGYSSSGIGIEMPSTNKSLILAGNSIDDCTTSIDRVSGTYVVIDVDNDEGTTASPFADPNAGDFTPQDVNNVKEGSWPGEVGGGY